LSTNQFLSAAKIALYTELERKGFDRDEHDRPIYEALIVDPAVIAYREAKKAGMTPEEFLDSALESGRVELL